MRNPFWQITLVLSILFARQTLAENQEPMLRFNHLTVNDGLSQNSILAIAKDKYGFMWFGTWEGVNRFDGYRFQVFRANEDDTTALTNNRINALATDSAGNLWIRAGDDQYLFRFDYEAEHFTRIPFNQSPLAVVQKLSDYRLASMHAENDQFRWTATKKGLIQTDKRTGEQQTHRSNRDLPFSLSDSEVNTLYLDDSKNLWVGTPNGGINRTNLHLKPFNYYSVGGSDLTKSVVRAVTLDAKGKLWIGTHSDGITVIDRNKKLSSRVHYGQKELVHTDIRCLFTDKLGQVWIGTKGGLDRYDPSTGRFHHYLAEKPGSIQHPWVFAVSEDHLGTIWVGTFGGLARYDRKSDRFTCLNPVLMQLHPNVRVILEDHKHQIWIATEGGGVTLFQQKSKGELSEPVPYRHQNGVLNSLINDLVLTMVEDEYHKIWIGTNSGLCRLDPVTGKFDRFSVSNGFPDDLILGLQTDGRGQLWISHKKGLTCLDVRTFKLRNFNQSDGLQGNEFSQNAYYRNPRSGELFFGGTNGLNSFFPERITINPIKSQPVLTGLNVLNQPVLPGMPFNGRVLLEKALFLSKRITLPWEFRSLSVTFSSLNYDNPYGCRYKYRLNGIDEDWIDTNANQREATYTYLPAGEFRLEVHASNSDGIWSEKPATLMIRILPPWWLSWWAKLVYLVLFCLTGWFVYRFIAARIEFRNRLLLERLRNEKNEELTDLKLQFFTEISHEFRTPLTLIIDPLERLIAGTVPTENIPQFYSLMNRNAKQLLDLINQLLDFRKVQSKNLSLNAENADLVAFVQEVTAAFEQRAKSQQVRLNVLSDEFVLTMDFDTDKMRKILNNLISNAFRFTPIYGVVTIRLSRLADNPEMVRISVQDNGAGIEPDMQDKIFEAFFQAGNAKSNAFGTGIGLALTKELVLLHGGRIWVESEVGKGSNFIIELPAHQNIVVAEKVADQGFDSASLELSASEQRVSVQSTGSAEKKGPLLLFVDDQEDIRAYIRLNFSAQYEVVTACDGLEGFNKASELIPDVVVSDIMMAGTDGFELCRRLKSDERTSHIPVILLTARLTDESRIEGYGIGADAYITKPFNSEVLSARIGNLLEQRRLLQQAYSQGSPLEIRKIAVNVTDESFLNKTVGLIEKFMEDPDFDPDRLAELLRMSRSQLYRKIKGLTNRSVQEFITSIRMNRAAEYLLGGTLSISETAYKVGFSLPTNFSRTFTKHFGQSPSKYLEKHKK